MEFLREFAETIPKKQLFPSFDFFPSVEGFDCHPLLTWVRANEFVTPILACGLYLLAVFALLPLLRPRRKEDVPVWCRHLFALWNLALSVFSTAGFVTCASYVVEVLQTKGVHYLICSDTLMLGTEAEGAACYGPVGFMMSLFMLSKFPELLDTAFLVVMHKNVEFLHWYHHVTVLLYSWFAYRSATPSAVFFGTMNYFVHSVMYFYFFASQYTKALSFMRMPITALQLTQMMIGIFVTLLAYLFDSDPSVGCSKAYKNSGFFVFCACMYGSYFVLFLKLYLDSYVFKTRKSHSHRHPAESADKTLKKKQ
jgi:elongation of very long chain fatty acids protein 6